MTAGTAPYITPIVEDSAIRALIRTFGVFERVMQPYFARFDLSGAQWGVLRQLHRAETEGHASLRMTELSKRLLVRLPSATGVIDRLVRDGLVRRVASPTDLRVKQISLTDHGRERVGKVLAVHEGQMLKMLGGLDAAEQADLHRLLDQLRDHLSTLLEEETSNALI